MFKNVLSLYQRVWGDVHSLAIISLVWMGLAMIGDMIVRSALTTATTAGQLNAAAMAGFILHLLATLSGWYFAHRFMINPQIPLRTVPDRIQLKFVGVQIVNLIVLSVLGGAVIGLLGVVWIMNAAYRPAADLMTDSQAASILSLPIIVLIFSRLLLMSPLMARGLSPALRQSWRATKGHIWRLFALQVACLLPLALTEPVAGLLQKFGLPAFVPASVSVAGIFFSLWLYTRLAEDEYVRLIR